MTDCKVLRVNAVEEQTAYRRAVSLVLLNIQRDERLTLNEIAESIDVSTGTISNAANCKADLSPTFLSRLGTRFGGHYLDPYHALYNTRGVPLDARDVRDIMPFLARAMAKIADARDPDSHGGRSETHVEKLDYLPALEKLQAELAKTICDIRTLREGTRLRSVA